MLKDKYNHQESEKKWQKYWRQNDIFKWKNDLSREQTFVIDTPPPTVSGVLHMGHVFSYTQADFIARYQRMSGKDVFYPIGFDDNGLPTERLVEKIIGKKAGVFESENGHGSFTAKCREVVETAEKEFEILFNEIALSVDWSQKYQTISPQSQKISQASFVDLYHKKLVEKKFEPVFWDISDRTALAQADLVDKEVEGVMNYILFGIDGGDKKIEIMTTRPELLPACVAVMVHPNDSRYKHLHDKHAITPIFGVKVPIIADEDVLMDKGTGAVMCCTFGDEADIKWWKKYNLELKIIIGKNGLIEFPDFATIHHRKIKEAKDIIIEMLREKNLLKNQEKITRFVKCAERSGAPIEILVMPQWFVKILDKKEELKAKASQCNWYPNFMKVRIDQWIDGLSWDWCISRQRFFGVKFPVWFSKRKNEEGKILVANIDQLPCDPSIDLPKGYLREEVDAETDIMDTWATSSMSPQLSSQGISDEISFDEARHRKLFPADLRPQAHEIIRSWAFYTIVKAHLHENKIPWKNLMISGWCLAADKSKMSKSKGNVVTPTALIEEKGSDVVRYWASTSHLGADTAYSDDVFKIGQKLLTKLYNAAKFASMNFTPHPNPLPASGARESIPPCFSPSPRLRGEGWGEGHPFQITHAADLWLLSRLHQTVNNATQSFEKFEYARAREAIEDFFWNDFCDNYLEICKVRSYGLSAQKWEGQQLSAAQQSSIKNGQISTILTLKIALNGILKLFSPFIPHITEEIYAAIFTQEFEQTKSINARNNWPQTQDYFFDEKYIKLGESALNVIFEVRKYKSDNNLSMKTTISHLKISSETDLTQILEDLANVCNAQNIELQIGEDKVVIEI